MTLQKWNNTIHQYEPFEVPDDRQVALYTDDMNKFVQCANCGRIIKYGDSYTSRTIQTNMGFGYAICEDCYKKECEK